MLSSNRSLASKLVVVLQVVGASRKGGEVMSQMRGAVGKLSRSMTREQQAYADGGRRDGDGSRQANGRHH